MINYNTVRIMFFAAVLLVTLLLIRSKKPQNPRRARGFAIAACVVLLFASWFFPVENYITSFATVEAAFKYSSTDGVFSASIEGEQSALVIYTNEKGDVPAVLPRIGNGYGVVALPISKVSVERVMLRTGAQNLFYLAIYEVRKTNDTYIMAWESFGVARLDVLDNLGSEVLCIGEEGYYSYYAHLTDFDLESYELTIGGETYTRKDFVIMDAKFFLGGK